jgi:hypothetical protein
MQITIGELYEAQAALNVLAGKELPVKSALRVRRLARAVNEHITDANAERDKLIDKYGQHGDDGQLVCTEGNSIRLAYPLEFQAAHNELMATEIELDDRLVLRVADLGDNQTVEPRVLIGLGALLEEENA